MADILGMGIGAFFMVLYSGPMGRFQFSHLSFECLHPVCHLGFRNRYEGLRKWNIKKSCMVMKCDFILNIIFAGACYCAVGTKTGTILWHRILMFIYLRRIGFKMLHYQKGTQGLKCRFCWVTSLGPRSTTLPRDHRNFCSLIGLEVESRSV